MEVGDENSAPEPSFISKKIEDIFFYKNRLGMISGDSILFSETGEYYNFFPTTVTDVLDSDPIDVSVDSNHAVRLSYALPFNKELLIFGNKAQFTLSASKALSPKDVNIQQSTSYTINNKVAPISSGPNVFFVTDRNNSSIVREYFVVPDTSNNTAANITAHIPSYMPTGLIKMVGSEKHDMLFAIDGTSNKIYVYNFYWQGEEKAQSAWHTWEIGTQYFDIFNVEVIGSTLLVMLNDNGGAGDNLLTTIDLELTTDIHSPIYKDVGTLDINSRIEMSKWGIPSGQSNVDSNRSSLIIRDLQLSMQDESDYGVELTRAGIATTWNNALEVKGSVTDVTSATTLFHTNIDITAGVLVSLTLRNDTQDFTTTITGNVGYLLEFVEVIGKTWAVDDEYTILGVPGNNHKYTVVGNANNVQIALVSDSDKGFKLNSLSWRGQMHLKGSRGI